jgi:hypothetical protein
MYTVDGHRSSDKEAQKRWQCQHRMTNREWGAEMKDQACW